MTTPDAVSSEAQRIRENYESIVQRVRECGGDDVRVVAVTKTF